MATATTVQPKEPKTSHYDPHFRLGSIRMSPLMYGSLFFISSRHSNGHLDLDELSLLKQTQVRSFKTHNWIAETPNKRGIMITRDGRRALESFSNNEDFFRGTASMSFSSLLNLDLPDIAEEKEERPKRIHPVSETRHVTKKRKVA